MDIFYFIIMVFATYRLSLMFTNEDGPFDVFKLIRKKFGIIEHESGVCEQKDTFLGKLLHCLWCMSVYVATLIAIAYYFIVGFDPWFFPLYIFGLSGGAILIDKVGCDDGL